MLIINILGFSLNLVWILIKFELLEFLNWYVIDVNWYLLFLVCLIKEFFFKFWLFRIVCLILVKVLLFLIIIFLLFELFLRINCFILIKF